VPATPLWALAIASGGDCDLDGGTERRTTPATWFAVDVDDAPRLHARTRTFVRRSAHAPWYGSSVAEADRTSPVLTFDDRAIQAEPTDTVSAALLREGVLATSRSPKYRRARGPYCLNGDCGTCLVRIDGRPNMRACMSAVHDGMQVEPQNTIRPDALDPTRLVDAVFRRGFDHHHLMVKPRVVNQAMQTFARTLTGLGSIPDEGVRTPDGHRHEAVDVLIIGAGAAGRGVASRLQARGVSATMLERHSAAMAQPIPGWRDAPDPVDVRFGCAVFGAYPGEHWLAAASAEAEALRTFEARHIVVCVGAREPMLAIEECDLPGILAARGLLRTMMATGLELEGVLAVVGAGTHAEAMAKELGTELVLDPERVIAFHGRGRVRAIEVRPEGGGRSTRVKVDHVALAPAPAPAHELPVQLGARVEFDGSGFAVQRDADGRCGRFGESVLWAAGEVCGPMTPSAAFDDGARVADQLVTALGAAPT
jgi:sarcosine oxidase subunit alpha